MARPVDSNTRDKRVIYRRRLAAIAIMLIVIPLGMALKDTRFAPLTWIIDASNSGVYTAGDPFGDWVFAQCDGEAQKIVVLKEGQIHGIQALDELTALEPPDFCDLPQVDHPDLDNLRRLHETLKTLTNSTDASAEQVLNAALALPLTSLYLAPVKSWLNTNPARSSALLDVVSRQDRSLNLDQPIDARIAAENFSEILNHAALRAFDPHPDLQKLRTWLRSDALLESTDLIGIAAEHVSPDSGNVQVASELLERLDEVPRSRRQQVFHQLAANLISRPEFASIIVDQLDTMSNGDVLAVSEWMMSQPSTDAAIAYELLADFDDIYTGEQRELTAFQAIASKLRDVPGAAPRLAGVLDELSDRERRLAAIHMLDLDREGGFDFTLAMLNEFDELHPISKPQVIRALLLVPQFNETKVQQAALLAVETQMRGDAKHEILSAMNRYQFLDPDIRQRLQLAMD